MIRNAWEMKMLSQSGFPFDLCVFSGLTGQKGELRAESLPQLLSFKDGINQ